MLLVFAAAAHAAAPCTTSAPSDVQEVRAQLRELRRSEGRSIEVTARGEQCGALLDAALRDGPFLGVRRADPDAVPTSCRADLVGTARGWALVQSNCRGDESGPSRMTTFGAWLPYGVSARVNQEITSGVSLVLDYGWHAPSALFGGGIGKLGPAAENTSTMRGLVGLDFASRGLAGTYLGTRVGVEAATPSGGFEPNQFEVAFVGGNKWVTNGLGVQLGAGFAARVPMGQGLQPHQLVPVAEVRVGWTNRR
jgi:hypothetical protein